MSRIPPALRFAGLLVAPVALALVVPALPAQETAEVQWRTDYNSARKEAQAKGKPLVLDFGTQHCYWCRRLEETTFRDPGLVKVINEQFIPLKIDAEREATLAQLLRIQSYPTIVMAAPDGKILVTHEGYMDAGRFYEQVQRALAAVASPEWMTRDYQEAVKAIAASDYARAIALLRSVLEEDRGRPVQRKARQVLKDLEQQAADRLELARKQSDKGQAAEAMVTLTELIRVFNGTPAAQEAGQMFKALGTRQEVLTQQRTRRAQELLAQAQADHKAGQYLACLDRCEILMASFGDLAEGEEARKLAGRIKEDPALMQTACETLNDRLCSYYLTLAETWMKKGQLRQAEQCLERVLQSFPNSRQAEVAQVRLAQIHSGPKEHANFKKPLETP